VTARPLGWIEIARLGLVQTALGAVVVLTTSTLNRVMVVELALPAVLPGLLVALHYGLQLLRPRLGHGSDVGGRRTPWIVGGMATLALGGLGAAVATAWMATNPAAGIVLAIAAFGLIGIGVGASGTNLLVLLAKRVDAGRRAAAATLVWVMMMAGFVITASVAGHLLDPFSPIRLVTVAAAVAGVALAVTLLAVWNIEGPVEGTSPGAAAAAATAPPAFFLALRQVWGEPQARRLAIFVFVSMLAYSAQELILDPFAGIVFGYSPGQSTKLSGVQHAGVLLGMLMAALAGSAMGGRRLGSMRALTTAGCLASALALCGLAMGGFVGPTWPLRQSVFCLGVANGVYAVAAIGSMMGLVGSGTERREGVRMGLWGAAQAVAFGLGGLAGTLSSDLARYFLGSPTSAYAAVFTGEAFLFVVAGGLAARLSTADQAEVPGAGGRHAAGLRQG